MNLYNVRDYGAAGDGTTKDTAALQRAIDNCAVSGGGTVYLPPGTYLSGTLFLKDNLTLWLEAGAVLQASIDKADYHFAQVYTGCAHQVAYACLLYGSSVRNVAIKGGGSIDGQDVHFWAEKPVIGERWTTTPPRFDPLEWRPMLILCEASSNLKFHGIELRNSPVYSGWIVDCNHVWLDALTINNHFYGPNTDGFHFSSCQHVHIANCYFRTGDDSIAIDSNGRQSARNFNITNCSFDTSVNAFRIFTGLDPWIHEAVYSEVSDIAISNCTVANAAGVLNVTAQHGTIERIVVSNMAVRMEQEGTAIFLMADHGVVRHISMSHWNVVGNGACTVIGNADDCIEEISLSHINFQIAAKKKRYGLAIPDPIPSYGEHHFAPYGVYLRHIESICLHEVTINWLASELAGSWSAISGEQIRRIRLNGLACRQAGDDPHMPAVALRDVQSVALVHCTALPSTAIFLQLAGAGKAELYTNGNALAAAEQDIVQLG